MDVLNLGDSPGLRHRPRSGGGNVTVEDASSQSAREDVDDAAVHSSGGRSNRVTLAQVAARAGVSSTAASFVLAGRTDQRIAEETQIRVRAAAEELGYQPNLTARILRTGTSGTIALVSDFVTSTPYASAAVRGALEAARRHDTLLYIAETLGDPDLEERLLQGLIGRRVDGFVYATMFTRTATVPKEIRDLPLVLLNCTSPDVDAPQVVPDERKAGATAARALLDAGHRDGIFFVGSLPPGITGGPQWGGLEAGALPERRRGVDAELKRAGVELAGVLYPPDWDPEPSRVAVAGLLATGHEPRALICANDRVAMGAYQALAHAGLRIPQDVSVVSFDDSELAGWLEPGLTSIALPHEELGRTAVELLLQSARRGSRRRIPMRLHSRGSIAPPSSR
jgi:LacI family transcriptional regulator